MCVCVYDLFYIAVDSLFRMEKWRFQEIEE